MPELWGILLSAFLIGFSGAMMPGPMLWVAIEGSLKKGWIAGPLTVLGHGILEFILIIAVLIGLKDLFANPAIAGIIGLAGGVFLAWMGYGMIKSGIKKSVSIENPQGTAKSAGIKNLALTAAIVSVTNPYFILWWASTGMESVRQAYVLGLIGVLAFFIGHISSDFTWYTLISVAFSKGRRLMNDSIYRWIIIVLGAFIVVFSVRFALAGWKMLFLR